MTIETLQDILSRAHAFEDEAHLILAKHEATVSRVITIENTYSHLTGLSLQQDGLLREAIKCVENQLLKAAHVLAWAAVVDYLENIVISKYIAEIKTRRPKWSIVSIEDLREQVPEHQLITFCGEVKLFTKTETKAFLGLLNRRNECAHPSNYFPSLNETLGFVSELLNRILTLQQKPLP